MENCLFITSNSLSDWQHQRSLFNSKKLRAEIWAKENSDALKRKTSFSLVTHHLKNNQKRINPSNENFKMQDLTREQKN